MPDHGHEMADRHLARLFVQTQRELIVAMQNENSRVEGHDALLLERDMERGLI
jgi:hypothetical protein